MDKFSRQKITKRKSDKCGEQDVAADVSAYMPEIESFFDPSWQLVLLLTDLNPEPETPRPSTTLNPNNSTTDLNHQILNPIVTLKDPSKEP